MRTNFILILFFAGMTVSARTLYVSPSGSNYFPGTLKMPFQTISYAESRLRGGDTLFVRGGTYNEVVKFKVMGGSVEFPTVIESFKGESPVIDGAGILISRGNSLIELVSDNISFKGFEVKNSSEYGIVLRGKNCKVAFCSVHNTRSLGIMANGDYCIIEDCEVFNASMKNENGNSPSTLSNAIRLADQSSPIYGAVVRRCIVHDSWGEGISVAYASNCTVEDCIIYDTYTVLLYCRNSQNCLFQRNLVYMTKDMGGVSSPGIGHWNETNDTYRNKNNRYINNMVMNCDRNFNHRHTMEGLFVANNTFVNSRFLYNVYLDDRDNISGNFINNIVIQEDDLPCIYFEKDEDIIFSNNLYNKSYDSDAAGQGDIIDDPEIHETGALEPGKLSGSYFKLKSSSPAINHGKSINTVTDDFFKNQRDSFPDIGAHEFYRNDPPIKVSSIRIKVDEGSTAVDIGSTIHLIALISPFDAAEKNVAWSIINGSELATIDSSGLVTALDAGIITVMASSTDGSEISDTIFIEIYFPASDYAFSSQGKMAVYPNPARDFINIYVEESHLFPLGLKLLSFTGKVILDDFINSDTNKIPIGRMCQNGIYIVYLYCEDHIYDCKKLIVNK